MPEPTLISFLNVPNGRIGEPIEGIVVGTRGIVSVIVEADDPDDLSAVGTSVGRSARSWTVSVTPTRLGIINLTIRALGAGGLTDERRVPIVVVATDATVPAGGSARFRKVLPAGVSFWYGSGTSLVSTTDNGFWIALRIPAGETIIDGVEITSTAAGMAFCRFDANGVLQTASVADGANAWNGQIGVDDDGGAFVNLAPGAGSTLRDPDGTSVAYYAGTSTQVVARINADGTWGWSKQWTRSHPGELRAKPLYANGHLWIAVYDSATSLTADGVTYGLTANSFIIKVEPTTGDVMAVRHHDGYSGEYSGTGWQAITPHVLPSGDLVVTCETGNYGVMAINSIWGGAQGAHEVWLARFNTDLEVTHTLRMSNNTISFNGGGVTLDTTGRRLIGRGTVVASGGAIGEGSSAVELPYSGTFYEVVYALRYDLTDLEVTEATGESAVSGLVAVGPSVFASIGFTSEGGDANIAVQMPTSPPLNGYATTATVSSSVTSSEEPMTVASRPFGGAVVGIFSFTASNRTLLFDSDPVPPVEPISGSGYIYVLASLDANGQWSTAGDEPLPGVGGDAFPDLPGFDFDDLDPGIPGEDGPSTPGAPGPTDLGHVDEDEVLAVRLYWADADPPDTTQSYSVEFSHTPSGPWSTEGATLDHGFVMAAAEARRDYDRNVGVVIVPEANWSGTLTLYARVVKSAYPDDLTSAVSTITLVVDSVPDAPRGPYPTRMPTVEVGEAAVGTFSFTDPDGTAWSVEVATSRGGTYDDALELPGGRGTITVLDEDDSDRAFELRYDPPEAGFIGTYGFWVRITDSSALTSTPVYITGAVSGAALSVELQRISRGEEAASIEALTPLTSVIDLDVTEALDGPGGANVVVSVAELARRAEAIGEDVRDLVRPGSIELVVRIRETLVFTGPVTGWRRNPLDQTVSLTAAGLAGYLEARAIEGDEALTYTGGEQSAIVWDLIDREQGKSYGDLALTDGTIDTSNVIPSITFEPGATVASALYELRDRLNGPELWIDPDRTVRTAERRGTDLRGAIVFTPENCTSLELSTDWSVLANVIRVQGDGETGDASDTDSMAVYGRMVRPLDAEQLSDGSALATVATNYLGDLAELPEAVRFTHDANPERPFGVLDYAVGDAVTVEAEDAIGQVVEDVRIVERTIRLVPGTSASFEVEVVAERIPADGVIRGRRSDHNPEVLSQLYDALYRR